MIMAIPWPEEERVLKRKWVEASERAFAAQLRRFRARGALDAAAAQPLLTPAQSTALLTEFHAARDHAIESDFVFENAYEAYWNAYGHWRMILGCGRYQ